MAGRTANVDVGRNAADERPELVTEDGATSAAADIRAMAEQAEAEAAEAEAMAAAARARVRAIQLRRQAELMEAAEASAAPTERPAEPQVEEPQPEVEPEAAPTEAVETEAGSETETGAEAGDDAAVGSEPEAAPDLSFVTSTAKSSWYRSRRRPNLSAVAKVVAVLVIIASSVGSVWMVLQHRKSTQQQQLAAEFSAAARQSVVTLTSLDFNNAKQGVQRILDDSTGSFKDDFAKMAGDFTKVVEQSKVVEQGTVQAVALDRDSMTKNSAVTLVASTSEVTNAAGAKQDPRTFRLIVTMTRDGDQLKMSKVEFVP